MKEKFYAIGATLIVSQLSEGMNPNNIPEKIEQPTERTDGIREKAEQNDGLSEESIQRLRLFKLSLRNKSDTKEQEESLQTTRNTDISVHSHLDSQKLTTSVSTSIKEQNLSDVNLTTKSPKKKKKKKKKVSSPPEKSFPPQEMIPTQYKIGSPIPVSAFYVPPLTPLGAVSSSLPELKLPPIPTSLTDTPNFPIPGHPDLAMNLKSISKTHPDFKVTWDGYKKILCKKYTYSTFPNEELADSVEILRILTGIAVIPLAKYLAKKGYGLNLDFNRASHVFFHLTPEGLTCPDSNARPNDLEIYPDQDCVWGYGIPQRLKKIEKIFISDGGIASGHFGTKNIGVLFASQETDLKDSFGNPLTNLVMFFTPMTGDNNLEQYKLVTAYLVSKEQAQKYLKDGDALWKSIQSNITVPQEEKNFFGNLLKVTSDYNWDIFSKIFFNILHERKEDGPQLWDLFINNYNFPKRKSLCIAFYSNAAKYGFSQGINQLVEQKFEYQRRLRELELNLNSYQKELDHLKTFHTEKMEKSQEQLEKTKREFEQLRKKEQKEHEQKESQMLQHASKIEKANQRNREKILKLTEELKVAQAARSDVLIEKNKDLEQQILEKQIQISEKATQVLDIQKQIAKMRETEEKLQRNVLDLTQKNDELRNALQKETQREMELKQEKEDVQKKLTDLHNGINKALEDNVRRMSLDTLEEESEAEESEEETQPGSNEEESEPEENEYDMTLGMLNFTLRGLAGDFIKQKETMENIALIQAQEEVKKYKDAFFQLFSANQKKDAAIKQLKSDNARQQQEIERLQRELTTAKASKKKK